MNDRRRSTNKRFAEVSAWFRSQDRKPFDFQVECWEAFENRQDYLLHSSTGSGKTLAAWLGPVARFLQQPIDSLHWTKQRGKPPAPPLTVLWITPLKALSADTEKSLREPIEDLGMPWTIERRTGDSSASTKARQRKHLPTALITTPESLNLLLSYPELQDQFQHLQCIVVDEWHELLGTKRGTQTELALSRLSSLAPQATRCGLSATLGHLDEALLCLVGPERMAHAKLIQGSHRRKISMRSLLPASLDRFPWAGHIGTSMVPQVAECIEQGASTLVFTNTRNQTEHWYQELLKCKPDWAGQIALHHGSLDVQVRQWVEQAVRDHRLKAVVCTSSLDLGVDFAAVDQVIQIGSPKGIARLLQRAGRSGHQPDGTSRLYFVPTHAFELLELAAVRASIERISRDGAGLEGRNPKARPLDCLVQHAVTRALGQPFTRQMLEDELNRSNAYTNLSSEELGWALRFVVHGGDSLQAYPDFHRVHSDNGIYSVTDSKVAKLHRMSIGTIASDLSMSVRFLNGQTLGVVEEGFVARLKPGDRFQFAGRTLELVQTREGIAFVRKSKKIPNAVPRWQGGRMPLSTELAKQVRQLLDEASRGNYDSVELKTIRPILRTQERLSRIPTLDEILVESCSRRGQFFWCLFPFEGRLVHEGLSAVLGLRLSRIQSITLSISVNDYGLMLQSPEPLALEESHIRELLCVESLEQDLLQSLNSSELCKRQFREIARIAGLIHPGYPGQAKRARHLQASSNMFYDAFMQFDPNNLLLQQAKREVLQEQLEIDRLRATLIRMANSQWRLQTTRRPTPLSFPLLVEQMRQRLSSESLEVRVRRLQAQLERECAESS